MRSVVPRFPTPLAGPQPHIKCFVQAVGPAEDLVGGPARHGLEAHIEGALRAHARDVYRGDHCHPERDAEDREPELQRLRQEETPAGLRENGVQAALPKYRVLEF